MIFSEKGLARAMKSAYKEDGYTVACTDSGYIITGEMWGASIHAKAIPNTIKSLIVLHAGKLPDIGQAICVKRGETSRVIFEMAVDLIYALDALYHGGKREVIRPTRLTMDGYRLWQQPNSLAVKLIDPAHQQILDYRDQDAYLVGNTIYGETVYGIVFVCHEVVEPETKVMLAHLEQMQWIPVELEATE